MFNVKIPLYGILIIFSFLCGLLVIYINSKLLNLKKEEKIGFLIYIILGSIFGGKYFTFITNIEKYNGIFDFSKIGLSSYGAIIGIIILIFLFSKQYKRRFKELVYVILPAVPLMYAIGKIGCFFSGCCHGIKYNGVFNVVYYYSYSAPNGINLFPVQLLEAIIFLLIFIYVFVFANKKSSQNIMIGKTFAICGISKFLLDYLRMSHSGIILSVNQIISLMFIIVGFYLIFKETKYLKNN